MSFLWFLSRFRNPVANGIFQFFTLFGEELLVVGLVCFLFWCLDKKMAVRIGLSYFVAGLLVQMLKIIFCIPRPWILDSRFQPVASAVGTATGYSFPSGHSQGAASLWGVLGLKQSGKMGKAVCFLIVFFTGFSRMFLGVHTPKDVAVGLLLGLVSAVFVCSRKMERCVERYQNAVCFIFGLISLGLFAFAAYRIHFAGVEAAEGLDCCKAAGAGLGFAIGWYLEERYVAWNPEEVFKNRSKRDRAAVFILGLAAALLLKVCLKTLMGGNIAGDSVRYAVLVLWIVALYPALVRKKICNGKHAFGLP